MLRTERALSLPFLGICAAEDETCDTGRMRALEGRFDVIENAGIAQMTVRIAESVYCGTHETRRKGTWGGKSKFAQSRLRESAEALRSNRMRSVIVFPSLVLRVKANS